MTTARFAVIGDPIEHSLSPLLHSHAFKLLGIEKTHTFEALHVLPNDIEATVDRLRDGEFQGLSVTIPHKQIVFALADEIDPIATAVGATNTLLLRDGKVFATNTDVFGVVYPLSSRIPLKGRSVAVLGAGGAALAAVYGLTEEGAKVTVFNRTLSTAERVANRFGCKARVLTPDVDMEPFDIIVHLTSVGMWPNTSRSVLNKSSLLPVHMVFDGVYNPMKTELLNNAEEVGAEIVCGLEMFVAQGVKQLELYTGQVISPEVLHPVIREELTKREQKR